MKTNQENKQFTIGEQIAEIKRELALRKNCYPKWIGGRLTRAQADKQLGAMEAALKTLEKFKRYDEQLPF